MYKWKSLLYRIDESDLTESVKDESESYQRRACARAFLEQRRNWFEWMHQANIARTLVIARAATEDTSWYSEC